jgi:hypothetical protein
MAPKRSSAPLRTSQRASRPSQKAAPTASAVHKTTKTTPRAAVTQALLTPAAFASAALAHVSEVEVVEAPAAPVAPAAVQSVHPFTYKLQWRAMLNKTEIYAERASLQSNIPDSGIAKVEAWFKQMEEESNNYKIVRTMMTATHAALSPRDRPSASLNLSNYTMFLEDELTAFERGGKVGMTIHVISQCRLCNMDDVATVSQTLQASQASQAPRATQGAPRQPRVTATSRQQDAMPAEVRELEVGGNFASTIIREWTCNTLGCNNREHLCYWPGEDDVTEHVPIIKPVLLAWSEAIQQGRLDASRPSPLMHSQIMRAKQEKESPRRRQQYSSSLPPINVFNSPAPVAPAPVALAPVIPAPAGTAATTSSPLAMPSDCELSMLEGIAAFIAWCKIQPSYGGEGSRLDEVQVVLDKESIDLEGMTKITVAEWLALGLRFGYRSRLKKSAATWVVAGMPVPEAD